MPSVDPAPGAVPVLPPALAADAVLMPLLAYWQRQRHGKPFPDRADISPLDLGARLLPHVGLLELDLDNPVNSRLRLVGTALVDELGADPTGQRLGEYTSGVYLDLQLALLDDVLRHRRPVFCESGFRLSNERFRMTRRLCLPLSQGGSTPALLLIGQTFRPPADLADLQSITRAILPA